MTPDATPRSATKLLAILVACALVFMIATFGVAAALGYADERRFHELLDSIASEHGVVIAGAVIFGLLAADLFLPLPSSALMMLAGTVLGASAGFAVAFAGSFVSAALGFALCRRYGRQAFRRLCGEAETARVETSLARLSPWLLLATRAAPMLAEIAACLAGLGGMRTARFVALTAIGTAPVAAIYAWAGSRALTDVGLALGIGIVLPIAGFAIGALALRGRSRETSDR